MIFQEKTNVTGGESGIGKAIAEALDILVNNAGIAHVGRMGEPDEIGSLALYLCSDEASFITGSIFSINGGFVTLNT